MQFRDKAREKQRQKAISQAAAQQQAAPPAAVDKAPRVKAAPDVRLPAAKRRLLETRQDVDDLAGEYSLLRKLKKGKLSEVRWPI